MLINLLGLFCVGLLVYMKNLSDVHKFQLFGYYMNQYLDAQNKSWKKWLRPHDTLFFTGVILTFLPNWIIFKLIGVSLLLITLFFNRLIVQAYPAKKKCVYTPRVKRMLATSILLIVFIGIITLNLPELVAVVISILLYTLSFLIIFLANTLNKPIESAINQNYYNDALRILKANPNLIVIGITGSYGKTSTKNVLYTMLSKDFNVLMTPESFNTKMGLTRTIREHLKPTHQILIAEMGAKEVGDIKELCTFVKPKYGVITSIGPQHLDTFKTFENIVSTKGELFQFLEPGGIAFVNVDDENVRNIKLRDDVTAVRYSTYDKLDLSPDYYIEATTIGNSGSSFTLVQSKSGKKIRISTRLLGRHNLSNVVAGLSIALTLGVPFERLGVMTADLKPVEHRLSTRRVNDMYTILDDAFNSNPVGSRMALDVLKQFDGNKKIVITPGMIELGDRFYDLNSQFGEYIAEACDFVILVGKRQTQPIQDGLERVGYPKDKVYIAFDIKDAFKKLGEIVTMNDVVLIENDLPDTYNE